MDPLHDFATKFVANGDSEILKANLHHILSLPILSLYLSSNLYLFQKIKGQLLHGIDLTPLVDLFDGLMNRMDERVTQNDITHLIVQTGNCLVDKSEYQNNTDALILFAILILLFMIISLLDFVHFFKNQL